MHNNTNKYKRCKIGEKGYRRGLKKAGYVLSANLTSDRWVVASFVNSKNWRLRYYCRMNTDFFKIFFHFLRIYTDFFTIFFPFFAQNASFHRGKPTTTKNFRIELPQATYWPPKIFEIKFFVKNMFWGFSGPQNTNMTLVFKNF